MKIRSGFVSNSSSSSFLIYGAEIDKSDIIEMAKKMGAIEKMNQDDIEWDKENSEKRGYTRYDPEKEREDYEIIEWLEENFDLEIHNPSYYDCCYVGSSWSNVGDDETGREFKARVKKSFEEAGLDCELSTLAEAWRDG